MSGDRCTRSLTIVPPAEVMDREVIREEKWRVATLLPEISSNDKCIRWLARRRLICNAVQCPSCQHPATLVVDEQHIDGHRWRCHRCRFTCSVRHESVFVESRLSLKQIILCVYFWALDLPYKNIARECSMDNKRIVVDWCNSFREECESALDRQSSAIGGLDENGKPLVVEIEQTKYFHRKYREGEWEEGHWVFGGIERGTEKCFLAEVQDRSPRSLQEKIMEYILPGSHIVSEGWATCANIPYIRQQGLGYTHSVIVREQYFDSRHSEETVRTANTQSMWLMAKQKFNEQFGSRQKLSPLYLHEFLYRNAYRGRDLFSNFIVDVSECYLW